jgi:adenylyltransferase/sulfurtransferase
MTYKKGNPRYQRQISLKEVGDTGQEKLHNSKVLVVGAGGLGSPALQYLAGAGIGTIGIVDDDIVALNNLHRQVLFSSDDVGLSKSGRAADILNALNPEINLIAINERLNPQNALNIITHYDIVLDGTDNFETRYMINDACVLAGKPLIYGAISRFEGQLAVFNFRLTDGTSSVNYRDLFPNPPGEDEILNCEEAGVIGVLPGIIGTMMANETIKLITGVGVPLVNKLLNYNSLTNQVYELDIESREDTRSLIPASFAAFKNTDYGSMCSSRLGSQIDPQQFEQLLQDNTIAFIDVREPDETPLVNEFKHLQLPLSSLQASLDRIEAETLVLFCQSGKRSATAAKILSDHYSKSKKVYSLKDGIVAWKNARKR